MSSNKYQSFPVVFMTFTNMYILQVILRKVSFKMTPHLELFAATVITQMGNSNVSIRTQIAKILFQMCDLCGPQQVRVLIFRFQT